MKGKMSSILGLVLGVAIVYYAIINTGNSSAVYMNFVSLVIVFGGSFSVALMTYGVKKTGHLFSLFFRVFKTSSYSEIKIVEELLMVSKGLYQGDKSIEQLSKDQLHPFLKDGLYLIHNKFEKAKLKKILVTMLSERESSFDNINEQIVTFAKYPPAFGMMGTIIGLVSVLNQISDANDMSNIGPSMAVALITTLYGIFLSNYIIQPIGDNYTAKNNHDIKVRKIIIEGVLLINESEDPVYVREILLSYLMPAERNKYKKNKVSEANASFGEAA